ncbi:EAL domain-containing protein [Alteromonas aestuariivivens]|uniref:EAL domain-containing protein n=1 Tax=Alteromonas aestuariivivens TaxID=1938339 RepID=A0A3D8M6B4_9ALTE|nr:EAL domain-containing protein [Alteromonas aestuariivivens]RDV25277.1 EAL domain-containing protein [Alteromonas aestuariivivens]
MRSTLKHSVLCLLTIFACCLSAVSHAVSLVDIYFTELNQRDGLSDLTIVDIVEDANGYMWFASVNGLNRYSGYSTRQYHPSDVDPNSIPSGYIRSLFVDHNGTLWVGTLDGLARYQPQTDNFKVFTKQHSALKSNDIWAISQSSDNQLIVADKSNLYVMDPNTETLSLLDSKVDFPDDIKVIRDEASRIWIGTYQHGVFIYSKKEQRLYSLSKVNPWSFNIDATTIFDVKVVDGEYWLATDRGVFRVANSGETLEVINQESHSALASNRVTSILPRDDSVWLTTINGLSIYDKKSRHFVTAGVDTSALTGLTQKFLLKIYQDSTGGLWIGALAGAFKYHPDISSGRLFSNKREFQKREDGNSVWGLSEDEQGNVWFATQHEGIGKFNIELGTLDYYLTNIGTSFWDLEIDAYGRFWLASSNGLQVYELEDDEIRHLTTLFEGQYVASVFFDGQQIWTWSPSEGVISIRTNQILPYLKDGTTNQLFQHHPELPKNNAPVPIFKDAQNRLWLTDESGELSIYDESQSKIVKTIGTEDGLTSRAIRVHSWRNFFWATTLSDGVLQIDKRDLKVIARQQGPVDGSFILASVGLNGSVWYANSLGLHRVDLSELTIAEEISLEQMQFNSLNEDAVLRTRDDRIIFAGNEGFNVLARESSTLGEHNAEQTRAPQLFEFEIFGYYQSNDVKTANQSIRLQTKSGVDINYDQSRFSISYGLVNPRMANTVEYRYRLTGFEDNWIPVGNDRVVQFNNVKFGSYEFELQAKEPGKAWSKPQKLEVRVGRPPWLYTSALAFYALILASILIYVLRQYQTRKAAQIAIRESEERLKLTLWSSGDELWDWDVYRGRVYRSNTWGTLDFPQDNIRTQSAYDANIHPNDIVRVQEALQEHLEDKSDYFELAYRAKTFTNKWIWILDRGKVVQRDHNNQPIRMTGTLKNIHHLKQAEEQLNLFKRSIENISEGVFIADTNFKFISVNNAYCRYTGETREQALASYMYFHQYPDAFTEEIKKTLRGKGNWSGEVESVRVNGDRYEIELNIDAVHDEDGKISHFVGVFSDITSRKSTEKELLKLANTDPLTELPNRSFFQASHQNLVRKSVPHALLCLDMDNFKKINDSLGHQTGDVLIKQIAKRLLRITGTEATCYRLGGDEFSILVEDNSDIHFITHYAQSILDTLSRPFIINKQEFVLGASVGIAFYPDDGNSPQEMLKNADTAMYFAKNNGGNGYQFFSGEMNQNAVRQLQIENLIRQGIKDDLFSVYYQPKVDITTGKLVSMEALVRFEHPQKGIVSPGQFIPLAEQTGQIIEIGEQVLRKACADTKRWVSQGIFSGRVAVNLSAKQFELPDLDDRIDRVLQEVGLSPLHLECEITEGTLMANPEQGLSMMDRLRERGIHLALDDFGTGYSSLAYLKRFPLNTLKIDKAFIDDIAESSVDRHMCAAIINIAHNLGLKVVAEGVEHESQLTILRRYDCEMLQGYLYSRPLSADRFEKLLKENQQLHDLIGQSAQ